MHPQTPLRLPGAVLQPLWRGAQMLEALGQVQASPPPPDEDEQRIAWENAWF